MARAWKPLLTKPLATMPATKYWLNVTPGAMSWLKTDPKMHSSSAGKMIVKTTDSRWRRNRLSSMRARPQPTFDQVGVCTDRGRGRARRHDASSAPENGLIISR